MSTESSARIDELLQKIEERIQNSEDVGPTERTKLATFLSALRKEREAEGKDRLELIEQIKAYEEAYEKLTQPANRTGTGALTTSIRSIPFFWYVMTAVAISRSSWVRIFVDLSV